MPYYRDLQESLEYWNKEAPKGATHYAPRAGTWYKLDGGQWFGFSEIQKVWKSCGNSYPAITVEKPEA